MTVNSFILLMKFSHESLDKSITLTVNHSLTQHMNVIVLGIYYNIT